MADLLDFSNPNTMGYIGLLSGLGQAAMPSRLPVPTGAVMGMAAQGLAQGQQQGLQNAMLWQRLNMMRNDPILNGSAFGAQGGMQASPAGRPSQPAIPPSSGGALGSGTFGIPTGGQQAAAPASIGSQGGNPSTSGGGLFGGRMTPMDMFRLGYSHAMVGLSDGPELMKLAAQYDPSVPTEATKLAAQSGQDPRAANAALLRKNTYIPPTQIRGFGIATPEGLQPLPMNAPQGSMPYQDPNTGQWSFVPVQGGAAAIGAAAGAEAGGKAAGKAPFESQTFDLPDGRKVQMSPAEWKAYQESGQLPARLGGQGGPAPAPSGSAAPNGRYPTPAAAGAVGVSQTPGAAAAQTEAGKGAGQALVADQNWANGFASRMFNLNKALSGLQTADTGPGSESVNQAKSFLLAQSPDVLKKYLPGVDPQKIASYDEANKYLIQYAMGQAGSLGEGTDSKLATVLAGNANTHISNLAAQDVVRANMALERMKNAQVQEFNGTNLPPDKYQKWASTWNSRINPAVFAWDSMTPEAKAKAAQGMTKAQQAQFRAQYNWALQRNYIDGAQ